MNEKACRPRGGKYPDVVVMGKPLREWAVDDTGGTTGEMSAWKQAVAKATGAHFDVAVGPVMSALFDIHFERLADEERQRELITEFEEGARALGFEDPKIISRIVITPPNGGPNRNFAGVGFGNSHAIIGLDEGRWRIFDIAEVLDAANLAAATK